LSDFSVEGTCLDYLDGKIQLILKLIKGFLCSETSRTAFCGLRFYGPWNDAGERRLALAGWGFVRPQTTARTNETCCTQEKDKPVGSTGELGAVDEISNHEIGNRLRYGTFDRRLDLPSGADPRLAVSEPRRPSRGVERGPGDVSGPRGRVSIQHVGILADD
jgi:hypothetical protein